jgi:hypothetical protein
MRSLIIATAAVVAILIAGVYVVVWDVELPTIGHAEPPPIVGVEPICADTLKQTKPDLEWTASDRQILNDYGKAKDVALEKLPLHDGDVIRVAGFLHVEFEWVALYPSRDALMRHERAPWVALQSLWPGEGYWGTRGPAISDRCAVVEGRYSHAWNSDSGLFGGMITVTRLQVWSTPYRPFSTAPRPATAKR